jgi:predicted HTH domain antitoxin
MIDLVLSDKADPELLSYYNPAALAEPPKALSARFANRVATLKGYLADAAQEKIHVSEKVVALWRSNLDKEEQLLQALTTPDEKLKRDYLDKATQLWDVQLKQVLFELNKEIVCPYALGNVGRHHADIGD